MPRDFPRSRRMGEEVQRLLSDLIRRELKDPRVGDVTITEVRVNKDMSCARVFFSCLEDDADVEGVTDALRHAAGYLRSQLASRIRSRTVPELRFEYDVSLKRGSDLDQLIADAVARERDPDPDEV